MTPEQALRRQIERYRNMTGEERLRIALDRHAFSCEVAREALRRQYPSADAAEIDQLLRKRLEAAYR